MDFQDLRIYQLAEELQLELSRALRKGKYDWKIPEVDQVARSSSSIMANIVEGYGRKSYPKDYTRFLVIAMGSSDETQNHISLLKQKKCIKNDRAESLAHKYKSLSVKILNLISFIKKENSL